MSDNASSEYPTFAVTVDLVVVTIVDEEPAIVLIRRGEDPFSGEWALPGGFKKPDETLDEAARRELLEETNLAAPGDLVQFGAYGDPGRDPRTNVVSIGYLVATNRASLGDLRAGGDAADVALVPVAAVRSEVIGLAFDHRRIVDDAMRSLADRLEQTGVAPRLLDEPFTLTSLRRVYERVWDDELNPANFRRALLSSRSDRVDNRISLHLTRPGASEADALSRPTIAALRSVVSHSSVEQTERLLWSAVGERVGEVPFLVPDGQPSEGGRGDRYRATIAWDIYPAPIRRPRRRR